MTRQESYHFIGIGGIGMSGLARLLLSQGKKVTGSDITHNYVTKDLEALGATIHIGHNAAHVSKESTVIFSSDIPKTNPELQAANTYRCTLLHRSDLLTKIIEDKEVLTIAGTHGKTTTSSLLAYVLALAKFEAGFAVGGLLNTLNVNAQAGNGRYFVIEADESDGTFLKYDYVGGIVTNIDTDHLSHFGTFENLTEAFQSYVKKAKNPELLFICDDDPTLKAMRGGGVRYGFSKEADLRASNFSQKGWQITFDITFAGKHYPQVVVGLTGKHNAQNATAVFGLALKLGVPEKIIREALASFPGVRRRMERKGDLKSILVVDDYAHHPTEIKATLRAIRGAIGGRRLLAVFQPHRYSRMQYCINEFTDSFDTADLAVITDLYTAGETPVSGVSTETICQSIEKSNKTKVHYIPRQGLVEKLHELILPHDVVITFGAGDITKVGNDLVDLIAKKSPRKLSVGVFFGGMNCENEISERSVKHIISCLHSDLYTIHPFKIGLDGKFQKVNENFESVQSHDSALLSSSILQEILACDILFPVLHGPYGEDGIVQGFFETLRKPYVGCDVRAASVCMDKALVKKLVLAEGIATAPFVAFSIADWKSDAENIQKNIVKKMRFPLFVKPSHLGSSVGITKVTDHTLLAKAIDHGFEYDTHILVEEGLEIREIEFAVRGNFVIEVPKPGEVLTGGKVYDYEAKYGSDGCKVAPTADLPEEVIQEGQKLAEQVYRALGCMGLARVDFFLDKKNKWWLNEVNPIPGFTSISLYPQIWKQIESSQSLIDSFIILGLERFRMQERIFEFSCRNLARK